MHQGPAKRVLAGHGLPASIRQATPSASIFTANCATHGFLLSQGTYTAMPDVSMPVANTYMLGMNPQGDIVGWSCCGGAGRFLISHGSVTILHVPQSCGSPCTLPYAINPLGDIVGIYIDNDGNQHGFLLKKN
jgi:hypothetical protein